jgi:hypothetical protein
VSARSFETVTTSTEGPTAPVRRPVFEVINGGAQPEVQVELPQTFDLGERPTPVAEPAVDPTEKYHFDGPIPKFERGGTKITRDVPEIIAQQDELLAASRLLNDLR